MSLHRRLLSVAFVCSFVVAAACGSDESTGVTRARLAQGCALNSDCEAPLVCAYKRCHSQCNATRDCPAGQRCVLADKPFHVCQLREEKTCKTNADCPSPQVCGVDKQCRDNCITERDCLPEQLCANGTCAEPSELTNGQLPNAEPEVDGGGRGQPCARATDCPSVLVCKDGFCNYECVTDKDCFVTWKCTSNRCTPP